MIGKENVEITAETITDYLSKLCKNTVSIYKMLDVIHNDNLEIKNSIVELNKSIQNLFTITSTIKTKPKDIPKEVEQEEIIPIPIITQPYITPNKEPQVVNEITTQPGKSLVQTPPTQLPEEQPLLSIKDQIQLALRKKQLDNSTKELRCFQPQHQPAWLGTDPDSDKILKNLKPDTSGLV
jgi:hypothetical protein